MQSPVPHQANTRPSECWLEESQAPNPVTRYQGMTKRGLLWGLGLVAFGFTYLAAVNIKEVTSQFVSARMFDPAHTELATTCNGLWNPANWLGECGDSLPRDSALSLSESSCWPGVRLLRGKRTSRQETGCRQRWRCIGCRDRQWRTDRHSVNGHHLVREGCKVSTGPDH